MWLKKTSLQYIMGQYGISKETMQRWRKRCSKVAVNLAFVNPEPIGGPGSIVEIDESKYGKRKLLSILQNTLHFNY
jgi:hypothetical protein